MKVLIVDDSAVNRYQLNSVLGNAGHTVISANNGSDALKLLAEEEIDLIISDVLMPVMDGFEFCRRVKSDPNYCKVPFIVYTSTYTGSQDKEFAMSLGAQLFLLKPCDPDLLLKHIEDVMSSAQNDAACQHVVTAEPGTVFKLYNERLINKLEHKMIQLEKEIEERKQAESQRVTSELRYRCVFESSPEGILLIDADTGEIVDINPYLCDLIGYPKDEIIGMAIWKILPFGDLRANKVAFAHLKREGKVSYEGLKLSCKGGNSADVDFSSIVYSVNDLSVIQCNVRNIGERMAMEKALESSRSRYLKLHQSIRDAIACVDMEGNIREFNQPFVEMMGYTAEELAHFSYKDITPSKWHAMEEAIVKEQVLIKGHSVVYEKEYQHKNGTIFPVEIQTILIRDDMGKPAGMWAVVRDISERKHHEEQRSKLEAQLRLSQKLEAVGTLANGVAHDFNNLLSVILGHAEIALITANKIELKSPITDDLQQIQKACERASSLTRKLLAFSRKKELNPCLVNLSEVVLGIEGMFRRLIGEDIELILKLESELGLCLIDPTCTEQILMNLIVNARDAMPNGGKISIETANLDMDEAYASSHVMIKPGHYIAMTVSDNGCGMTGETLSKIFEPFFTTKEPGKGTGLGLSLVYDMVEQSSGAILAYSEPGQGSTFKILFPRQSETEIAACEPEQLPLFYSGTETILIAEDDGPVLSIASNILSAAGYTVFEATSGPDALNINSTFKGNIDLLLTDIVMPSMKGDELADKIRQHRPGIKVVFMSGYPGNALQNHGVIDQSSEFIAKPFSATTLMRKIRSVLDS